MRAAAIVAYLGASAALVVLVPFGVAVLVAGCWGISLTIVKQEGKK